MATTGTTSSYDAIADWYEDWLGDGSTADGDLYYTPVFELIGDVNGLRICDLACGQGRVARHLASLGAQVIGIDASAALLTIAERYQSDAPTRVEYRHDDAHTLSTCPDGKFDGVICNMALMDIPDLEATVRSAFRVLRPGGWFAFSALHPCFNAPKSAEIVDEEGCSHRTVTDYFTEGHWQSDRRQGPAKLIGAYHRTLTTYLNTLIETGFVVEHFREVSGPAECWLEVPPVFAVLCRRPESA